jgi:hypothetical protein
MRATRTSQPYRKNVARAPGAALTNMLRGRSVHGFNPIDATRAAYLTKAGKRHKRPARPQRPKRPVR